MQYAVEAWLFNGWHLETADGRGEVGTHGDSAALTTQHWPQEFASGADSDGALVAGHWSEESGGAVEGATAYVLLIASDSVAGTYGAELVGIASSDTGSGAEEVIRFGLASSDGGFGWDALLTELVVSLAGGDPAHASEGSSGSVRLVEADLATPLDGQGEAVAFFLGTDLAEAVDILRRNGIRLSDVLHAELAPSSDTGVVGQAVLTEAAEMSLTSRSF